MNFKFYLDGNCSIPYTDGSGRNKRGGGDAMGKLAVGRAEGIVPLRSDRIRQSGIQSEWIISGV